MKPPGPHGVRFKLPVLLLTVTLMAERTPLLGIAGEAESRAGDASTGADQVKGLIGQHRYQEALSLARELLAKAEQARGPDSREVSEALDSLVLASTAFSAPGPQTLQYAERAVRIKEKAPGPDQLGLALSLNLLGNVQIGMGDYETARQSYERSLKIREKVLGPNHLDVGKSLNNIALTHVRMGEYAEARSLYERALTAFQQGGAREYPEMSFLLHNLASVHAHLGDVGAARRLLLRVVEIQNKALGPESPELAGTLGNLCNILKETGEYATARSYCEHALRLREKDPGPDSTLTAAAFGNLADVLMQSGDLGGASDLIARALAIHEKLGLTEAPTMMGFLKVKGSILLKSGDLAGASKLFEELLRRQERTYGPAHPDFADALRRLSAARWGLGDAQAGFEGALRAEIITRQHLRHTMFTLSEREALRSEAARVAGLDLALSILLSGGFPRNPTEAAVRVWDEITRSRAIVLDEVATRHQTLMAHKGEENDSLMARLSQARRRLSHLLSAGPGKGAVDAFQQQVQVAQEEEGSAERALAEKSALFRQQLRERMSGFAEMAESLPPDSGLVAYVRYDRISTSLALPSTPSYLALVISAPRKEPVIIPLGSAGEIDPLVKNWSELAGSDPRASSGGGSEQRYRAAGGLLRKAIWDPVASALSGVSRAFIVPDGLINLVNFATLPSAGGAYLIEDGPMMHYLSAERDIVRATTPPHSGRGLLSLGDPDFDAAAATLARADLAPRDPSSPRVAAYRGPRSACGDFHSVRFDPLPGSRAEVDEIESLWVRSGATAKEFGEGSLKLTGASADEATLKGVAGGFRILHLATHGFFLQGRCGSAPTTARDAAGTEVNPEESPLLLSGLALSGANRRNEVSLEGTSEDGILTAEEIASLDLSGVEWAVLSGCDTGIGKVLSGEGVLGLRRAFQVAGARTLVMSLWAVEDDSTRVWMRGLYEGRLSGLSTIQAVRAAGMKMLETQRRQGATTHPFFWGGFVAAGDWR